MLILAVIRFHPKGWLNFNLSKKNLGAVVMECFSLY